MYYTVKQISMRHPGFFEGALRGLIFNEKENGFSSCVCRPPGVRKVLIHEQSFEKWIRSNHQSS